MTKIVTLSAIVLLSTAIGVRSQTNEHSTAGSVDSAAISKALTLLGKAKSIDLSFTVSAMHSIAGMRKAEELVDKKKGDWKDKPLLPAQLMALAEEISNIEEKLALNIVVSDPQDLKTIQKILGKEDAVQKQWDPPDPANPDIGKSIWWYTYGQWKFKAVDSSVTCVRLNCPTPKKK